ncbi:MULTISPECIES: penicillin-binding protein 2 [Nitrospirillum]|uniref:Peptidoglycan glycosyltransferase n=1 Tax=Nitrospirillum amazonense TaxID=28077 RepID=A0A560FRP6_9PROT|nr:penicillin-binding protein 2 [Nitrospirillum amazonense]MEC4591537.1 penicillin-binding protein 2 [Nitrospirillum amazonense]TWB24262.1 peptidoglycan glycosyltransferase [Nitrospirillum amazonense]
MFNAIDRDAERQRVMNRRTLVLGGLKAGALSALVARLYYLQILEGDHYTTLAEDNRISLRLLAPSRGIIVDRSGVPLAVNEQNFRAVLVSERTDDVDETLDKVVKLLPLTDADRRRILRDVDRLRSFAPVTLRENLTWDQVSAIEVNLPDLPGVSIEVGQVRSYPFGEQAAHILGYVGVVSEQELQNARDPLLSLPGFRIGKSGIERKHDLALRGTAGTSQLEVNAVGRVVRELARNDGQPGHQVTLTIDAKLQYYAQQRLAEHESAAAVVLDVQTGGILALASHPSFDPNQFAMGIPQDLYDSLIKNEASPLTNKVVAGHYAPGSTFKPMTALAGLEAGVDPTHRVFCPGHYDFGGHTFHCYKKGGHGSVDMHDAIRMSCDVYFYDLARRIGVDRIADMARRFGLGDRTDLDLPGEKTGIIPDTKWKRRTYKENWYDGETLSVAIGQGYVTATPIQLAVMCARLASGGKAVKPHLTKAVEQEYTEQTAWPDIGVKPEFIQRVLAGMAGVTSAGGTAYAARITQPGFEMGGKSGTAQVKRITMAERNAGLLKAERPWKDRDNALFIAFAPVQAPRYACAIIVEHGVGGSSVAAPIARDLLLEIQLMEAARAQQADAGAAAPAGDGAAAATPSTPTQVTAAPVMPGEGTPR